MRNAARPSVNARLTFVLGQDVPRARPRPPRPAGGSDRHGRVPSLQALIDADASAPPVPPVPIGPSARGSFRHRALSELDLLTLSTA